MYRYTRITRDELNLLSPHIGAKGAVYLALKLFAGSNNTAYPTRSTLSEITGYSVPSVARALSQLLEAKLITRTGYQTLKSGQSTAVYSFPVYSTAPVSQTNTEDKTPPIKSDTPYHNLDTPPIKSDTPPVSDLIHNNKREKIINKRDNKAASAAGKDLFDLETLNNIERI